MDFPKVVTYQAEVTAAMVTGYDPVNHGVFVSLPSLQQIGVPAKVLINGPCDSSRVEQNPLPIMGTWGLVMVLGGDTKSAVWLGAFANNSINAFTYSKPPTNEDGQTKYMSHASGAFSILDYFGNWYYGSPDGTSISMNVSGIAPTIYRNSVDESGNQVAIKVPNTMRDYRNPNPPSPFYLEVNHPSGSSMTITPSGIVTIVAGNPAQASITMTPSGLITIQTGSTQANGAGPIIILDPTTQNLYIKGQKDLGQIQIDPMGNVTIISAQQINIEAEGGDIFLNTSTHSDSVNTVINTFNVHTHGGVQTGSGNTAGPNSTLP